MEVLQCATLQSNIFWADMLWTSLTWCVTTEQSDVNAVRVDLGRKEGRFTHPCVDLDNGKAISDLGNLRLQSNRTWRMHQSKRKSPLLCNEKPGSMRNSFLPYLCLTQLQYKRFHWAILTENFMLNPVTRIAKYPFQPTNTFRKHGNRSTVGCPE